MKKILYYPEEQTAYDATDELEDTAWLKLFTHFDYNEFYFDLSDEEYKLYESALSGNPAAAKKLLYARRNCEYETFYEVNVE